MPIPLSAREPKTPGIFSAERFHDFTETLEICREHAISENPSKTRLALIALDNLAEIFMYHKCQEIFESEDYIKHVIRPRLPMRLRGEAEKDFPGKVRFLSSIEKYISAHDAVILRISHSYRNVAFHRDEHNPSANGAIARILLDTVCRMFRTSYEHGGIVGGHPEIDQIYLRKYGYIKPYLEFAEASQRISSNLIEGTEFSHATLRTILINDLLIRHRNVIGATLRGLPLPEIVLDVILKSEEFEEKFDFDTASARLREALYGFNEGKIPPREEYLRLEQEYTVRVRGAFDQFRPETTWRRMTRFIRTINRLSNATSASILLDRYHILNEFLSRGERYLYGAIRKNDAAAEVASDIELGK